MEHFVQNHLTQSDVAVANKQRLSGFYTSRKTVLLTWLQRSSPAAQPLVLHEQGQLPNTVPTL